MDNIIVQLIIGLLCLSFLVFIHELGHFLVAKKVGVKVETFSIGFGKKLIQFKRGETTYCFSAIPFGGYVAMKGESPNSRAGVEEDSFATQSILSRAAIALGGPVVNIVFAFVVLIFVFMLGYPEKNFKQLIVGVVDEESPAMVAGILPGDTLVAIDGNSIKNWDKLFESVGIQIGKPVELTIKRKSETLKFTVVPEEFMDFGVGHIGIRPLNFVLANANPEAGQPAHEAGFVAGDTLLEINGRVIASSGDLIKGVQNAKAAPIEILVGRPEGRQSLRTQARYNKEHDRYLIGLALKMVVNEAPPVVQYGFLDATKKSLVQGVDFAIAPFRFVHSILTGGIKVKAMSGPVGIVQVIGKSAESGFVKLLWLMALISMNLGIMNLLPLAVTDGGVLMFLTVEAIRGKPLSNLVMGRIQQVFFSLFIALFIYITFHDASRFTLLMK